jgi:enoyl-CoA hydratase/carnithine racemase
MELILTGQMMGAAEAEASGMVASVVPQDSLMQEALRLANTIAEYNSPAVRSARGCEPCLRKQPRRGHPARAASGADNGANPT